MIAGYRNGRPVVPTLYDFDAQSTPRAIYLCQPVGRRNGRVFSIHLGPWDIRSHGIKTEQGVLPQGMTSFTRIRLGWIAKEKIKTIKKGESEKVLLSPLLRSKGETRVVCLPIDEHRYYLIENRQQEGIDRTCHRSCFNSENRRNHFGRKGTGQGGQCPSGGGILCEGAF